MAKKANGNKSFKKPDVHPKNKYISSYGLGLQPSYLDLGDGKKIDITRALYENSLKKDRKRKKQEQSHYPLATGRAESVFSPIEGLIFKAAGVGGGVIKSLFGGKTSGGSKQSGKISAEIRNKYGYPYAPKSRWQKLLDAMDKTKKWKHWGKVKKGTVWGTVTGIAVDQGMKAWKREVDKKTTKTSIRISEASEGFNNHLRSYTSFDGLETYSEAGRIRDSVIDMYNTKVDPNYKTGSLNYTLSNKKIREGLKDNEVFNTYDYIINYMKDEYNTSQMRWGEPAEFDTTDLTY